MDAAAQSTELTVLIWSVLLLLGHIVVQTLSLIRDCGPAYAVGDRDGSRIPGPVTARLTRGLTNYVETYVAFVALALALMVTGRTGGLGATGALIWFWARLVYVPVYAAGIPVARTAIWSVSVVGLILMLVRLAA